MAQSAATVNVKVQLQGGIDPAEFAEFLKDEHYTLWGHSCVIHEDQGRQSAGAWIANQVERFLQWRADKPISWRADNHDKQPYLRIVGVS